jgi:hypothetical protein
MLACVFVAASLSGKLMPNVSWDQEKKPSVSRSIAINSLREAMGICNVYGIRPERPILPALVEA